MTQINIEARIERAQAVGDGSPGNPYDFSIVDVGMLTTDHAASSYGQPVYVGQDGIARGAGDLDSDVVLRVLGGHPHTLAETRAAEQAAADAGYRVAGWR